MSEVLPPEAYNGQRLCPCCGVGPDGEFYGICVNGYPCDITCAVHVYGDLCPECAA